MAIPLGSVNYGDLAAQQISRRFAGTPANAAALTALTASQRADGMMAMLDDGTKWRFDAASTAADTSGNLVLTPDAGTGRWMRADNFVDIKLAVGFATADAAVLFTVPVGFRLRPTHPFWEVTTAFTGGSSSAIGLSSSHAAASTKGDLLGGASGDVLAGLTAGLKGTVGTSIADGSTIALVAADTILFDRITSVFTAGAGFAHVPCEVIAL